MLITGKDNPNLKLIRSLSSKNGRKKANAFAAEGKRLVEEIIAYAAERVKFFAVSEEFEEKNKNFMKMLDETGKSVYTVKEKLFRETCTTEHPQGVLAVMSTEGAPAADMRAARFVLILDGVSEPGNMGTIIRTAEAAGVDAILLCGDCVDVYNPKTVRSTMGSLLRVPLIIGGQEDLLRLKEQGFHLFAAALDGTEKTIALPAGTKRAVVIGNEAHGISKEVLRLVDTRLRIPMHGKVESLNAAVAAGILMYRFSD